MRLSLPNSTYYGKHIVYLTYSTSAVQFSFRAKPHCDLRQLSPHQSRLDAAYSRDEGDNCATNMHTLISGYQTCPSLAR